VANSFTGAVNTGGGLYLLLSLSLCMETFSSLSASSFVAFYTFTFSSFPSHCGLCNALLFAFSSSFFYSFPLIFVFPAPILPLTPLFLMVVLSAAIFSPFIFFFFLFIL
jgi:hypothetical protein